MKYLNIQHVIFNPFYDLALAAKLKFPHLKLYLDSFTIHIFYLDEEKNILNTYSTLSLPFDFIYFNLLLFRLFI